MFAARNSLLVSAAVEPVYIEDTFSTWLYTGTGATLSINNGIDLSGEGGLTWIKSRSARGNYLFDTERGAQKWLVSNETGAQATVSTSLTSFNNDGFSLGSTLSTNYTDEAMCSWTFRKQAKFFDVVTWTGTGPVNHNLQAVPGFVIYKATSTTGDWNTIARQSDGSYVALYLNSTGASLGTSANASSAGLTATTFNPQAFIGASAGVTYVAYLFAHDAGGFGTAGTDNVISCGSYSGSGAAGNTITLGYEPQFLLIKCTTTPSLGNTNWLLIDVMRGMPVSEASKVLYPNTSGAEATFPQVSPTATGFILRDNDEWLNASGQTYIYMAIRRGPMKTPTSGTSVFAPYVTTTVAANASGSTSTSSLYRSDFVTDFVIQTRKAFTDSKYVVSRLTGNQYLVTNTTAAEATSTAPFDSNIAALNFSDTYGCWMFRRAPGFFDVVCYTGTGSATTVTHNLGAVPELIIIKQRNSTNPWRVYSAPTTATTFLALNTTAATTTSSAAWNDTAPTSSVFTVGTSTGVNGSGGTYVAYLFATVAGVSKVGSYAGTGATQTINCGFTGGARFVLIKRTNDAGGWYVWDTARGMVAGTDPFIPLNTTDPETNLNTVYTTATGFEIVGTDPELNASGSTYIYLAIA